MSLVKKKFESYFRDRLTFLNVDSRTSRRIYRLALLLRAPETLSSLSKSRISIFNAHLTQEKKSSFGPRNVARNPPKSSNLHEVFLVIKYPGIMEFPYQQQHRNRQHSKAGNLPENMNIPSHATQQEKRAFHQRKPGWKNEPSRSKNQPGIIIIP